MAFVKYTGRCNSGVGGVKESCAKFYQSKQSVIIFNAHANNEFKLDRYRSVSLYYNNKTKEIGVELFKKVKQGTLKLSRATYTHKHKSISVDGFIKRFNLTVPKEQMTIVKKSAGKKELLTFKIEN